MSFRFLGFTILFLATCGLYNVDAQTKSKHRATITHWAHNTRNCHHLLSATTQCRWNFFTIKGNLVGTIVEWTPMTQNKDVLYAASVAIIKSGNENIRVLLLSNYGTYTKGQKVKFAPDTEPEVDTDVPFDRDFYIAAEKNGTKPTIRINAYDQTVMKTTWAKVVKER